MVFAGNLGGGVRRTHVAGFKSTVEHPAQATIHAVPLAMAAMFGNSLYVANGVGSAEMDRAGGALYGKLVRARFCGATFPAALVGPSRRSSRDAGQHAERRGLRRHG